MFKMFFWTKSISILHCGVLTSLTLIYRQFQGAMLFKDSVLVDRIFRVFDSDDDDLISFAEYIACLSRLSNKASDEDKLRRK